MVDNAVNIVGNLTDDPELRYTQNGTPVANMRVAVNRRIRNNQSGEWEDRTDGFFNVTVWRDMAENVAESLHRGARVMISGRLTQRSFETQQGEQRTVVEIEADEVCPSLRWATAQITKTGGRRGGGAPAPQAAPAQPAAPAQGSSTATEPDDVPF